MYYEENFDVKAMESTNYSIAQTLDKILKERKKSATEMTDMTKYLEKLMKNVERLREINSLAKKFSDKKKEDLFGSQDNCQTFDKCMEKVEGYYVKLQEAIVAYQALAVRFQRETVNLGVIGKQGVGKSLFLQSLSGLSDDFIPSADGPSYTGVTCIIENTPEEKIPQVFFTMKEEKMVLNEIKKELQNLWEIITKKKENLFGLDKINQLKELKEQFPAIFEQMKGKLYEKEMEQGYKAIFKKLKEISDIYWKRWEEWFPLVYPSRVENTSKQNETWVETEEEWHQRIEEWHNNLKKYSLIQVQDKEPYCKLEDLSTVKDFITKRRLIENGEYYANVYHIAIKEALIKIAFEGVDSRIRLIDTVGIGDKSLDTQDRMDRAIDAESDGLIFIHRYPEPAREYEGANEVNQLATICSKRKDKRPGDWTAFLVNVRPKKECDDEWIQNFFEVKIDDIMPKLNNDKTLEGSAGALNRYVQSLFDDGVSKGLFSNEDLEQNGQYISMKDVFSVGNNVAVKKFLNQFLAQISRTLANIDTVRQEDAERKRREAEYMHQELLDELKALYKCIPSGHSDDVVSKRMGDKRKALQKNLYEYYIHCTDDIEHKLTPPLKMHWNKINSLMKGEIVDGISLDTIAETSWIENIPDFRRAQLRAMDKLYMSIRQIIHMPSNDYEQVEREYKEKIATIFVKTLGLDLEKLCSNRRLNALDSNFFYTMGELLFQNNTYIDELPKFFYALQNFHLNDSKAMAESIVCHIANKHLCIYATVFDQERKDSNPDTKKQYMSKNNFFFDNKEVIVEENKKEDKEKLKEILCEKLKLIDNDMKEFIENSHFYNIDTNKRMKEELMSFMMSFGEPYREPWTRVFQRLYENNIILQGEMDEFKNIQNTAMQIKKYMKEFCGNY